MAGRSPMASRTVTGRSGAPTCKTGGQGPGVCGAGDAGACWAVAAGNTPNCAHLCTTAGSTARRLARPAAHRLRHGAVLHAARQVDGELRRAEAVHQARPVGQQLAGGGLGRAEGGQGSGVGEGSEQRQTARRQQTATGGTQAPGVRQPRSRCAAASGARITAATDSNTPPLQAPLTHRPDEGALARLRHAKVAGVEHAEADLWRVGGRAGGQVGPARMCWLRLWCARKVPADAKMEPLQRSFRPCPPNMYLTHPSSALCPQQCPAPGSPCPESTSTMKHSQFNQPHTFSLINGHKHCPAPGSPCPAGSAA